MCENPGLAEAHVWRLIVPVQFQLAGHNRPRLQVINRNHKPYNHTPKGNATLLNRRKVLGKSARKEAISTIFKIGILVERYQIIEFAYVASFKMQDCKFAILTIVH